MADSIKEKIVEHFKAVKTHKKSAEEYIPGVLATLKDLGAVVDEYYTAFAADRMQDRLVIKYHMVGKDGKKEAQQELVFTRSDVAAIS